MRHLVYGYILPAAVALVALTATVLLFFAGPAADDFCRAVVAGVKEHFVESYLTQTGRWISVGLLAPLLLSRIDLFSSLQYGGLLFALWCGYFAVFYFLVRAVASGSASPWTCGKAALLVGVVWWCGLPVPGQTVYWVSAGLEYGLGFQAAAALFGALVLYAGWDRRGVIGAMVALGLAACTLVVTGFHEIVALCVAIVTIAIAAAAFVQRRDKRFVWLALSSVAALGVGLSILAPGNEVRAERLQAVLLHGNALYAMYLEWYQSLAPWLTDPRLLCASFLVLANKQFAQAEPRRQSWIVGRWWLIALCTLATVAACLALPVIMLGQPGPGRLHNFAYSVFVTGWFLALFAARRAVALDAVPNIAVLRASVGIVFVIAILFTGNMQAALSAFIGRNDVFTWHGWLQQVERSGTRAGKDGSGEFVLSAVPAGPAIYTAGFQRVPDRDPANFINRCMSHYLGLSSIRAN